MRKTIDFTKNIADCDEFIAKLEAWKTGPRRDRKALASKMPYVIGEFQRFLTEIKGAFESINGLDVYDDEAPSGNGAEPEAGQWSEWQ